MKETKTLSTKDLSPKVLQWKETIAIAGAAILIPFLLHIVPVSGAAPLGAQLLPMFYVPFIAVLFFRFHVAFIAAAIAPVVNTWLSGHPDMFFTTQLTLELLTFTTIAFYLKDWIGLRWVNAPIALIASKLLVGCLLALIPVGPSLPDVFVHLSAAVTIGAVGIFVLWILNILFLSLKNRLHRA